MVILQALSDLFFSPQSTYLNIVLIVLALLLPFWRLLKR